MALMARFDREQVRQYEEFANEEGERSEEEEEQNRELETRTQTVAQSLEARYRALAPEERTAVMHLCAMSNSVLMPLALVGGACNEGEYALGVMAAHGILGGALGTTTNEQKSAFNQAREEARIAMDYIRYYRAE